MAQRRGGWYWHLGLASLFAMGGANTASGDCALAQIVPDGTLPNNSIVTPQGNTSLIEGGTQAGSNLFHSFEQFSVPTGGAAYFNNASAIQNIISRVTGGEVSNINGLLRANGTANLFLLNPNGIIFGPNASLNIGGSFLGSTASAVNFADGTDFSATAPQTTPLLTVSVPIGLQYGSNAGRIQVQGSGLQVQTDQTLALIGGDVSLESGEFGFLSALGGRIELGGLTGAGIVEIEGQQSEGAFGLMSLRFPDEIERADVLLTNLAYVNVAASGGGSIAINARNIDISGGSVLRGGLETNSGFLGATAGDMTLNATGAITIANSDILNTVSAGAEGKGGKINITTGSLSVTDGAQLLTSTYGQGDAGSVNIHAGSTVSFDGVGSNGEPSAAGSQVAAGAMGKGGGISITAESLSVTNGAVMAADTFGRGDAGSVTITAHDTVSFDGGYAYTTVDSEAEGKGGDINITARSLSVTKGAELSASTFGRGDGGSVTITAHDTVSFDGVRRDGRRHSGVFSTAAPTAMGNGGGINITTGSLSVTNGAQLVTMTGGQGNAGSITIKAYDTVSFDGDQFSEYWNGTFKSGVSSGVVYPETQGKGGDIHITAGSLSVTNGATLSASTEGEGAAGNLKITTKQLIVRDRAQVSVSSLKSGNAGNLEVGARSIRLDNQGSLNSDTTAGQGNIILRSQDLVLRDGSNITTNATGSTIIGGNITINTDILVALENSDISANSTNFRGGNVIINTQGIFGTEFRDQQNDATSDITATGANSELSGTVEINTPDVDPSQGLATLPAGLVEASGLIATGCAALGESKFIVTGRGGLPENPSDPLSSDAVQVDLVTLNAREENVSSPPVSTNPTNPAPAPLVEAQGWMINDKGEVVLTATAPNVAPNIPWMNPATCHGSASHQQPLALSTP